MLAAVMAAGIGLASAQTPPVLPSGVQDVVRMAKAGLDEDVIVAQVRNAGTSYTLSADQLIYLHDQGLTPAVIKALLAPGQGAPAPTPSAPTPAPSVPPSAATPAPAPADAAVVPAAPAAAGAPGTAPVSLAGFQAQLAPFGTWMDVPGLGSCWHPAVAVSDPFWRPYFDGGHWAYTADGWLWQSDYPWGDVAFHYGRWHHGTMGWVWVPGYDWAPAWVCWRHVEGYCGWAPLPPAAVFKAGVGLWFGGRVAVDVDFGLRADMFTFVPYGHFWDHGLRAYLLPRERSEAIFSRSVVLNGYRIDHGRFVVEGLGRERVASLTRHDIRIEAPVFRGGIGLREGGDHRLPGGRDERERRDR